MKNIVINNTIAILEELLDNGNNSPESLYAWFLGEQKLIEQTLETLNRDKNKSVMAVYADIYSKKQ